MTGIRPGYRLITEGEKCNHAANDLRSTAINAATGATDPAQAISVDGSKARLRFYGTPHTICNF